MIFAYVFLALLVATMVLVALSHRDLKRSDTQKLYHNRHRSKWHQSVVLADGGVRHRERRSLRLQPNDGKIGIWLQELTSDEVTEVDPWDGLTPGEWRERERLRKFDLARAEEWGDVLPFEPEDTQGEEA